MYIGKRLYKVRKAKKMEKEGVIAGILTKEELREIEKGKFKPSESILNALAERLEVPAEYFVAYETEDEQLEIRLQDARLFLDTGKISSAGSVIEDIASQYTYINSLEQEIHYLLLKINYYVLNAESANAIHTYDNELCPLVGLEEQLPEQLKELFYSVKGKVNYLSRSYAVSNESYLTQVKFTKGDLQKAHAYNNAALSFYEMHRTSEAVKYCEEAIRICTKLNEEYLLSRAYLLLGLLHYDGNHYDKAMKYYKDALVIGESQNDSEIRAKAANNIGDLYKEQEEYDKALYYLMQSLKVEKEFETQPIIFTYYSILEVYYLQNEKSEMKKFIAEAEKYVESDTDFYLLQVMKARLSLLQGDQASYEKMMSESISYLYEQEMWKILHYSKLSDEMLHYYSESENHKDLITYYKILSDTYRHLCEEANII